VIAPLLGLLGTVTGMIDVFEVMALSSSSNTRAMAAGVSKATIPTMAGMVVAVIGLLFEVRLQKKAHFCVDEISGQLELSFLK
jgi:biopolymer transport protein ExbB